METPLQTTLADIAGPVCQRARAIGFDRVRFWERGHDAVTGEDVLVLTYAVPEQPDILVGYQTDVTNGTASLLGQTSIDASNPETDPVVAAASVKILTEHEVSIPKWVYDLDLQDREWIEADLIFGTHHFGLLAADMHPGALITLEHKARFSRVARELATELVAHLYGLQTTSRQAVDPDRTTSFVQDNVLGRDASPVDQLLESVTETLARQIDAGSAAAFVYRWDSDTLTKAVQYLAPGRHAPWDLREEYNTAPPDMRLTGRAWRDKDYRYLLHFKSAIEFHTDEVNPDSVAWHNEAVGELRTILYAISDESNRRYLFRFINRHQNPELPFLYEAKLLHQSMLSHGEELRRETIAYRLSLLEQANDKVRRSLAEDSEAEGADLVQILKPGLEFDGISSFALFAKFESLEGVQIVGSFGRPSNDLRQMDPWVQEGSDSLIAEVLATSNVGKLRGVMLRPHQRRSRLSRILQEQDFSQVAVTSVRGASHTVYGLVPLRSGDNSKVRETSPGTAEAAQALRNACQLALNALTARNAELTAAGARRALGMITHEVGAPVTFLANAAEGAIEHALNVFNGTVSKDSDPDFPLDLQAWRKRITQRRDQIGLITKLSDLLAQESVDQRLHMLIKPKSISGLLNEVAGDVEHESKINANLKASIVDVSACRNLPHASCDEELLRLAFSSVIRNAVKYSMSPEPGEPPVIRVTGVGVGDAMQFEVENFGLAIPDAVRPTIFEPFVRGEIRDATRAIRGMGLGLFLARRLLEAHNGGIRLIGCTPVLSDRKRIEKGEGFKTTFRLWFACNLPNGPRDHTWRRFPIRTPQQWSRS